MVHLVFTVSPRSHGTKEGTVARKIHVSFRSSSHLFTSTISFFYGATPLGAQGSLIVEPSRTHSDIPHSVGLPWTGDQPDAENSTRQHTIITSDRHP